MPGQTPNLLLEYLDASQAQPEVKINDAWNKIDAAYGLELLAGITVKQVGDSPAGDKFHCTEIDFVGATVVPETNGRALVSVTHTVTTKGDLISFDTAPDRVPVGSNGQVLTADSTQALGLKWATPFASPLTTKGDVHTYAGADARLAVGSNGQVLTADSTQADGIKWSTPVSMPVTTKGDLVGFDSAADRVPVGSNGQVLTADSTQTLGVKWASPVSMPVTTKGDLVGFDTAADRVPVGSNGQVLTADSTQALGVKWAPAASVPVTTKGDILGYDTAADRVPVGSNGQVLTADSTQALGVKWATPTASPTTTKGDIAGFDSASDRIPVGSDGQVLTADSTQALGVKWATPTAGGPALPGSIPNLVLWWASDDILGTAGDAVTQFRERTPWLGGLLGSVGPLGSTGTPTPDIAISATQINSLPTVSIKCNAHGIPLKTPIPTPNGVTFFCVLNPSTTTSYQCLFGGQGIAGQVVLYLVFNAVPKLVLYNDATAVLATATGAWTAGTAFQANATYKPSTGAYAFRQGRAANGSGTGATFGAGTTSGLNSIASANGSTQNYLDTASVGELIVFNRVLTPTEITNIENYLYAKWSV
jgi:hypothetical protein